MSQETASTDRWETVPPRRRSGGARRLVVPTLGIVVLILALTWPGQALDVAHFVAENLLLMAPVMALAVGISSYIRASGADALLARSFEGRAWRMLLVAAAVGAVTPICGIGVLPIIAGLLAAGVPLAPVMAFWLASPITDPAMLTLTVGTLGLSFALAKTGAAFAIGLLGGAATHCLQAAGGFRQPLKDRLAPAGDACTTTLPLDWQPWRDPARRRLLRAEILGTGWLMLKWLTLAFALEALLRAHLPPELIAGYVGAETDWAIPLAVLIGTPIYVDGYAALPLVRGLIELGMTPGAALAFMVAGGITSAYASIAVFALVRLPVFLWYLALAVVGSTLAGYGYALIA